MGVFIDIDKNELMFGLDSFLRGSKYSVNLELTFNEKETYITNIPSEASIKNNSIFWIMEKIKKSDSFVLSIEYFTTSHCLHGDLIYKDGKMSSRKELDIDLSKIIETMI